MPVLKTLNPVSPRFLKSFIYNFAVDGGAVGTFTTSWLLPIFTNIQSITVNLAIPFTSGGSATIAFGYQGANTALMPATAIATLNAYGAGGTFSSLTISNALMFPDFPVNPPAVSVPVTMTVGTAALTAGFIIVAIDYTTVVT